MEPLENVKPRKEDTRFTVLKYVSLQNISPINIYFN